MRLRHFSMLLFVAFLVTFGGFRAAADEKDEEPGPIKPAEVKLDRKVDFQKDIMPILDANCIACHNVAVDESDLNLEEAATILKGGARGKGIVPGKPDKSLVYIAASRSDEDTSPLMPPLPNDSEAKALTPKQLGLLRQWILEGAKASDSVGGKSLTWQPVPSRIQSIFSLDLSPWARYVAAGRANQVEIYDLAAKKQIGRLIDPALSELKVDGKPMYADGAAHRDFVHAVAFSPDGQWIATGGYRLVKLWQKQPALAKKIATGKPVVSLAVSPDGQSAAAALDDHRIQLWDLKAGKPGKVLSGHSGAVGGLAFHPDGKLLVSGSADKTVRVWKLDDGSELAKLTVPAEVRALTLDKTGEQIVTGDADNTLRIWATPSATPAEGEEVKPVAELKGHGKPVTSLALILPNGTQVASGSEDGTVRTWDLAGKKAIRSMNLGAPVADVAVRPDGQALAAAGGNLARVWDMNGKQLAEVKGSIPQSRKVVELTEEQNVTKQRVSLADAAQKAADKNLKDRTEGAKKAKEALKEAEKKLAEAQKKAKEAQEKVKAAKAELDKKPDDNGLKKKLENAEKEAQKQADEVKKAETGKKSAERSVKLAEESVKTAQANLDARNKQKADLDAYQKKIDGEVDAAKKAEGEAQKPIRTVAFSSDGAKLLTGGDAQVLQVWNAQTGAGLDTLSGHEGAVTALVSSSSTTLSVGAEQQLATWNVETTWKLAGRLGVDEKAPHDVTASPFAHRVISLAFSPDGKLLATGGGEPSRSGELMLWDVAGRKLVRRIEDAHSDTVFDIEFSRDGERLLTGAADKFMKLFNVADGKHIRSFEGHTHHVMGVAFKEDGASVASAGADNAIKIWNVETGEQKRTINNYGKQVTSIAYIGTSDNLVSCGGDKNVKFHTASNGRNFRNFGGSEDFVYAVAASRDEEIVVAGGADGVLRVWNGKNGQSIATFEPPAEAVQTTAAK